MTGISRLELAPHHRPGHVAGAVSVTERWTWDFVVDGVRLSERVVGDVVGALGWGDAAWEATVADKLLGRSEPDVPPNRVALYVCPECGDLGCGAVTAALTREGDAIVWSDFRWDRDTDDAPDAGQRIDLGPFRFDRGAYGRILRAAVEAKPGPDAASIPAF